MKKVNYLFLSFICFFVLVSCASTPVSFSFDKSLSFTIYSASKNAKEYFQEAITFINEDNKEECKALLSKWENENSEDPELYLSRFLYYLNESIIHHENVSSSIPTDGSPYEEQIDEKGNKVYVSFSFSYDEENYNEACEILEKAITVHPLRLDLYNELISTYFNNEKWEEGIDVIYKVFDTLKMNNNVWLNHFNTLPTYLDNKEELELDLARTIHPFVEYLFAQKNEELTSIAIDIDNRLVKEMPNNYQLLNLVSSDFFNVGLREEALEYLTYAHNLVPEDLIIISNLALYNVLCGNLEEFYLYNNMLLNSNNEYWVNFGNYLLNQYIQE